jgi:hypothetical protein
VVTHAVTHAVVFTDDDPNFDVFTDAGSDGGPTASAGGPSPGCHRDATADSRRRLKKVGAQRLHRLRPHWGKTIHLY